MLITKGGGGNEGYVRSSFKRQAIGAENAKAFMVIAGARAGEKYLTTWAIFQTGSCVVVRFCLFMLDPIRPSDLPLPPHQIMRLFYP